MRLGITVFAIIFLVVAVVGVIGYMIDKSHGRQVNKKGSS
jgi:hypothetical protein